MNTPLYSDRIETPVGPMTIFVHEDGALARIDLPAEDARRRAQAADIRDRGRCAKARAQLDEYFAGKRRRFDLRVAPRGTEFQQRVWRQLCEIPYGETISYSQLAQQIGRPDAVRAVGTANGANCIPIVIPCHRVIGADGSLTGYAGGLAIKEALLTLEGSWPRQRRLV